MWPVARPPVRWASMLGWMTGSQIPIFMLICAMIQQYFPQQLLRRYIDKHAKRIVAYFNPEIRIVVDEFTRQWFKRSEAYSAIEAYLSTNCSQNARRLRAEFVKNGQNSVVFSMDENQRVTDEFNGIQVSWILSKTTSSSRPMSFNPAPEKRFYTLEFHKSHRQVITESYLQHVVKEGKEIRLRDRQRKLYTNGSRDDKGNRWSHITFEHPATFDTLAMEEEKKIEIVDDLLSFSNGKDSYAKIGKAWKRGYLLYGPPGTGKSTMIAAMANLLNYDVYDLELTAVKDNTELKKLLIETTSKSIIVIEDIDCSLDLTGKRTEEDGESLSSDDNHETEENAKPIVERKSGQSRVTLSGLLNFIDGLWSSARGERLIVFTTNYVEKLDPALIRRGRMDKHIELTYCSFKAFKVLVKNYLDLETHPLFDEIQGLMEETRITPADVAENLMPKSSKEDAERCLLNLIQALEQAKEAKILKESRKTSKNKELLLAAIDAAQVQVM